MITVAKGIIYIYSFSLYLFQGDKISQGHSEVINKMIGVYTHKKGELFLSHECMYVKSEIFRFCFKLT